MSRSTAIVQYRAAVGKLLTEQTEQTTLLTEQTTAGLQVAWQLFHEAHQDESVDLFVRVVNVTFGDDDAAAVCANCSAPEWQESGATDVDCNFVCADCRCNYSSCDRCGDFGINNWYLTSVNDGDLYYCDDCRDQNTNYCESCDGYYTDGCGTDHDYDSGKCDCEPQDLHFEILANSHGVLHQDERLLVTLPQGDITDEAVAEVVRILWRDQFHLEHQSDTDPWVFYVALEQAIRSLDRTWQTRQGNYTRRLSKVLYQQLDAKLDPGLLSRVGSTVRDYSGRTNQWYVEFTRDLNQPASAFVNGGSCWWGSDYGHSRCALKHWGGLALRTYQDEDQCRDMPSGRAWVQPFTRQSLTDRLSPTADIHGADAYVVFNGYGDLDGYTPARLLAYLTSRTYKKIGYSASSQYVNSDGYLVADQQTCDATDSLSIHLDYHQKVSA